MLPTLVGYTFNELRETWFEARQPILERDQRPFFSMKDIGEIFATRGIGKTWLLMTIALMVSTGKNLLGFMVPRKRRVLYVDGEMARQDVQERFTELADRLQVDVDDDHLVIVAADWQDDPMPRVDTLAGQLALETFVDAADLIIFDNRSCLFDPEGEKDPSAWQPANEYLLSLRRRGKAVLLAHHANRQGGARGIGKPEDLMNLVMKLSHPEGYTANDGARFMCDITPPDGKARGVWGAAAVPFCIRLTITGWEVEGINATGETEMREQILDYLRAAEAAGDPPKSANAALNKIKGNRMAKLKAWADLFKTGKIIGSRKTGFTAALVVPAPPDDDVAF